MSDALTDAQKKALEDHDRRLEKRGGQTPGLLGGMSTISSSGMAGRAQLAPRGGGDGRQYSPDRDIAYLYMPLMKGVLEQLGSDNPLEWEGWYGKLLRDAGVTPADIGDAAKRLGEGIGLFTTDTLQYKTAEDALEESGFLKTKPVIQTVFWALLGQMVTGAFFVGARDVTPMGSRAPHYYDLEATKQLAAMISERLTQGSVHGKR